MSIDYQNNRPLIDDNMPISKEQYVPAEQKLSWLRKWKAGDGK